MEELEPYDSLRDTLTHHVSTVSLDNFNDQVSRDHRAKQEEHKGVIRFQLLHNSLQESPPDQHLLWMLQLKQLLSRQLPRMPVEYITRLVFDP